MSSANEHFSPPPKPRMSPLDFRNTDLVSRLLAATPPYLYNMSLLPNTFFFSEMLRSFVQAKADQNHRSNAAAGMHPPHRRSRKRTWSSTRAECFQKQQSSPKQPEKQDNSNDWMIKSNNFERKEEIPLELTINKVDNNGESESRQNKSLIYPNKLDGFINKPELSLGDSIFPMHSITDQENNASSNLVLPPPPPMWYPPLYPAPPYGIDPLHFFIDLRVSGHIYDRKNQKESGVSPTSTFVSPIPKEKTHTAEIQEPKAEEQKLPKDFFKQSRHSSAFSVPIPSTNKTSPINLSHLTQPSSEKQQTKFDVKSMGFDKICNKTSTNYIMGNIGSIYNNVHSYRQEKIKYEETTVRGSEETKFNNENDGLEHQKKCKDLKSLLGLEFVVDYMNNAKPGQNSSTASNNSTDVESIGSPALEVVAVHDES